MLASKGLFTNRSWSLFTLSHTHTHTHAFSLSIWHVTSTPKRCNPMSVDDATTVLVSADGKISIPATVSPK